MLVMRRPRKSRGPGRRCRYQEADRGVPIPDESAMQRLGNQVATCLAGTPGNTIYLYGELGAGKTTLVRSILQSLGVNGRVKSPTYTLLEPYELADRTV